MRDPGRTRHRDVLMMSSGTETERLRGPSDGPKRIPNIVMAFCMIMNYYWRAPRLGGLTYAPPPPGVEPTLRTGV